MEARAEYLGRRERPRLTVVKDGGATYSALPHDIMRDTSISRDARLLYAILQGHWWQGGECWASHATLAAEMGCTDRHLRRFLRELLGAGKITERRRGHGQAKAYAPVVGASLQDESVRLNRTDMAASEPNRTDLSAQQDESVRLNRTDPSYRRRSTEEDTYSSKKPESDAANAAPAPVVAEPKVKAEGRARRLPDDWTLTDTHFEIAAKHGFDAARARLEGEKFSDHHRAHGKRMLDWMAAWRTWIRNAVRFDAPRSKPSVNGASQIPPGASSKQKTDWTSFRGRHGGNVCPPSTEAKP
jgi:hypothetical protein